VELIETLLELKRSNAIVRADRTHLPQRFHILEVGVHNMTPQLRSALRRHFPEIISLIRENKSEQLAGLRSAVKYHKWNEPTYYFSDN
jgi:hypothetical protein